MRQQLTSRLSIAPLWFLVSLAISSGKLPLTLAAASPASPLTPQQEMASFRLADPNLKVELVAAEPDVVSPVAIAWDADGRLFVAEMTDYPTGPVSGRIRLLEDRDAEGHYRRSTIFADKLPFPNGVLPWNGGVLVTAAPNIWFFKDTNGDGRADEKRVILTGFGEGNQQLRANGLFWGLDGWVYGANGRSDGDIRRPDQPKEKAVSIRKRDFRFRPATGEFEAIAGQSQFGTTRDDWGNRFLSWNTMPIRHEVIPQRYLVRNPYLTATDSVFDILAPGDSGRVFPISSPPLVFNDEPPGFFNALAGLTIYRGEGLGAAYYGNAFAGETLRNLVHRRVLVEKGETFVANRGEEGKEFLASWDSWFHPVNFATGPDGTLYVVDFYRRFVEHPHFVPGENRGKVDWREGMQHGRIWRISARNAQLREDWPKFQSDWPMVSKARRRQLVEELASPNSWWRDTAQRLLIERQDRGMDIFIWNLVRTSKNPVVRVQALWTLAGLEVLSDEDITNARRDPDAHVRENAIRLAEPHLNNHWQLAKALAVLSSDPSPRVRLQLALTLGQWDSDQRLGILRDLAESGISSRWQTEAILSSVGKRPLLFLHELDWPPLPNTPADTLTQFRARVATLIGAASDENDLEGFLAWLVGERRDGDEAVLLVASFADGLSQANRPLRALMHNPPPWLKPQMRTLQSVVQTATTTAQSPQAKPQFRAAAIRLLGKCDSKVAGATLLKLLMPEQPPEVQTTATSALAELADPMLLQKAFMNWRQYSKATRGRLIAIAARSPTFAPVLLDALDNGKVAPIEIDASARQSFRRIPDESAKRRVETLLSDASSADRQQIVNQFAPAAQIAGDPQRGSAIFERACLVCHAVAGKGNHVGPDLSSISSRSKETLLVDILDPSRTVSPDYVNYILTTTTGEVFSGVIAAESSAAVTMRRPSEADQTVPRNLIKSLRADGKSVMPDGLEQGLSRPDMADLLEFLVHPTIPRD